MDWDSPVSDLGPVDGSIGRNGTGQNKKVRLTVTPDDFCIDSDCSGGSDWESLGWDKASDATSEGEDDTEDWRMGATLNLALPSNVPSHYSDLANVFSKQKGTTLPPHRT